MQPKGSSAELALRAPWSPTSSLHQGRNKVSSVSTWSRAFFGTAKQTHQDTTLLRGTQKVHISVKIPKQNTLDHHKMVTVSARNGPHLSNSQQVSCLPPRQEGLSLDATHSHKSSICWKSRAGEAETSGSLQLIDQLGLDDPTNPRLSKRPCTLPQIGGTPLRRTLCQLLALTSIHTCMHTTHAHNTSTRMHQQTQNTKNRPLE